MKRWPRIITALLISLVALVSRAGTASAQTEGNTFSLLSDIIVPILTLIDRLLDFWVNSVTGNTLTDPMGEQMVKYMATIVQNIMLFFAEFSTLLTGNAPS